LPYLVLGLAVLLFLRSEVPGAGGYLIHLATFFVCALGCHVSLASRRPPPARLTEFYFWMALGGALGGAVNVLVAPQLFTWVAEYPIALAAAAAAGAGRSAGFRPSDLWLPAALACALAAMLVLVPDAGARGDVAMMLLAATAAVCVFAFRDRPLRFGLGVLAMLLVGRLAAEGGEEQRLAARSFYGVYRVVDDGATGTRHLYSGTTIHGSQRIAAAGAPEPLAYYHRAGPLGDVFRVLRDRSATARVAVVGLGAGAAASYARPGDAWTFYEIDPLVSLIASDRALFRFLSDAQSPPRLVHGDARLSLARDTGAFDLLVVDAFSSDAIPAHLMTREALALYRERLAPGGMIAWHISNKHVDLRPVLQGLAADAGLVAAIREDVDVPADALGRLPSVWVATWLPDESAADLRGARGWQELRSPRSPIVWRDDFSNVLGVLR
jgi:hypothetical protein